MARSSSRRRRWVHPGGGRPRRVLGGPALEHEDGGRRGVRVYPILGSRRKAYLLWARSAPSGATLCSPPAFEQGPYLAAVVLVAVGFMIQDVVADALSVEVAANDEEMAHIQTLGRMALLAGTIAWVTPAGCSPGPGPAPVFALAAAAAGAVAGRALRSTRPPRAPGGRRRGGSPGGGTRASGDGAGSAMPPSAWRSNRSRAVRPGDRARVSGALIVLLLQRVGLSRAVAVSAWMIFLFARCRASARAIATGPSTS